jgi:hypothetical protein
MLWCAARAIDWKCEAKGCMHRIGFALLTLLACAVTLTAAGCSRTKPTRNQVIERYSQELREAVSASVPAEGRRAQMLLLVDQLEAVNVRFSQETAEFIGHYRKLNADYDASRPAFEQLFSDYTAKRVQARSEALELHFQLASLASIEEWHSIGKAEGKLYEEVNAAPLGPESMK